MADKQPKVRPRVRTYDIIGEAVERGVTYGLYRAYKHSEVSPSDAELSRVANEATQAVIAELCDALTWDEEENQ